MEYSYILIESVDLIYSTIPPQVAMAIMSGIGSLFGRKKRQGEWDSQKRKYDAQLAAFKDFDFVNHFYFAPSIACCLSCSISFAVSLSR